MNELPILILTVGLPRSGKTTWAKRQSVPIVNPDSIRLALHGQRFQAEAEPFVWAIAKVMVRALFLAGHTCVILDATNTTTKRRDEWIDKAWETRFQHFTAPKTVCDARALAMGDNYILPIIAKMAAQFEPLTPHEIESLNGDDHAR